MKTKRPSYTYPEQGVSPAAMLRSAIEQLEAMTARDWESRRDAALLEMRNASRWIEGRILHEVRAKQEGKIPKHER